MNLKNLKGAREWGCGKRYYVSVSRIRFLFMRTRKRRRLSFIALFAEEKKHYED